MEDGYFVVMKDLWEYIPSGSHIRYKLQADSKQKNGFVKNHYLDAAGNHMMTLENKRNGQKESISYRVAVADVSEIWKKYSRESFIELHMIYNSLARKNKQIEELGEKIKRLEKSMGKLLEKNDKYRHRSHHSLRDTEQKK